MSRVRLFWDIETLPVILAGWGLYDQHFTHEHILQDSSICCASWRWDQEPKTFTVSILDDPDRFKRNPYDDSVVVRRLVKEVSRAKIAVAHNGDKFDIKILRTRALRLKLPPFRAVTFDTLKCLKKEFRFTSNRLDNVGNDLGHGRKLKTGGIDLWKDIIWTTDERREKAMRHMVRYNRRDVELLQKVYYDVMPWASLHPNVSNMLGQVWSCCPKCQSKDIRKDGFRCTQVGTYQKWSCKSCGNPFITDRKTNSPRPELKAA